MLRCVALVRTDISKESSAPIIRVTRIGELETRLALTSNRPSLRSIIIIVIILQRASVASYGFVPSN
jgi:hypothetical protein